MCKGLSPFVQGLVKSFLSSVQFPQVTQGSRPAQQQPITVHMDGQTHTQAHTWLPWKTSVTKQANWGRNPPTTSTITVFHTHSSEQAEAERDLPWRTLKWRRPWPILHWRRHSGPRTWQSAEQFPTGLVGVTGQGGTGKEWQPPSQGDRLVAANHPELTEQLDGSIAAQLMVSMLCAPLLLARGY